MGTGIEAGAHRVASVLRTLPYLRLESERRTDHRQREPGGARKRPLAFWLAGQPDHHGGWGNSDAIAGPLFARCIFRLSPPAHRRRFLRVLFFRELPEHRAL